MKQKTEITFEVEETIVLHQSGQVFEAFCPFCNAPVKMAAPNTIAFLSGVSEREIFRLIEKGKIHFFETDRIFICLNSLTISKEQ
jgi:hypothetical protein